jgi:hypothetical protein
MSIGEDSPRLLLFDNTLSGEYIKMTQRVVEQNEWTGEYFDDERFALEELRLKDQVINAIAVALHPGTITSATSSTRLKFEGQGLIEVSRELKIPRALITVDPVDSSLFKTGSSEKIIRTRAYSTFNTQMKRWLGSLREN